MGKKGGGCQVKIPDHLLSKVDRVVLDTGLYSDNIDFVMDAVRRLIIKSNRDEMNWITTENNITLRQNREQLRKNGFVKKLKKFQKSSGSQNHKR